MQMKKLQFTTCTLCLIITLPPDLKSKYSICSHMTISFFLLHPAKIWIYIQNLLFYNIWMIDHYALACHTCYNFAWMFFHEWWFINPIEFRMPQTQKKEKDYNIRKAFKYMHENVIGPLCSVRTSVAPFSWDCLQ